MSGLAHLIDRPARKTTALTKRDREAPHDDPIVVPETLRKVGANPQPRAKYCSEAAMGSGRRAGGGR